MALPQHNALKKFQAEANRRKKNHLQLGADDAMSIVIRVTERTRLAMIVATPCLVVFHSLSPFLCAQTYPAIPLTKGHRLPRP